MCSNARPHTHTHTSDSKHLCVSVFSSRLDTNSATTAGSHVQRARARYSSQRKYNQHCCWRANLQISTDKPETNFDDITGPSQVYSDDLKGPFSCRARDEEKNEQQKAQATRNRTSECPVRIRVSNPWGAPAPERYSADPVGRSRPQFYTIICVTRARHN